MSGVERAIVMEDLQEQKETSKIVLNIQDTRRYFESQGGDMKSSKIPDGVVSRGCLCIYTQTLPVPSKAKCSIDHCFRSFLSLSL